MSTQPKGSGVRPVTLLVLLVVGVVAFWWLIQHGLITASVSAPTPAVPVTPVKPSAASLAGDDWLRGFIAQASHKILLAVPVLAALASIVHFTPWWGHHGPRMHLGWVGLAAAAVFGQPLASLLLSLSDTLAGR